MSCFKLVPFNPENTETVLAWRNAERIRLNMLDDSTIGNEDHASFLRVLDTDESRAYFVVELRDTPVAAIYFTGLGGKEVTWGCYIGSEKAIPGLFVGLVIIAIKYSFSFPATESMRSEVASHNANPIKLNRFLGIPETGRILRYTSSGREVEFIEYRLVSGTIEPVLNKATKVIPSSIRTACENLKLEN
ncbi:MAG TPA: hypothetical protein DEF79_12335 [Gammaproteobacteria bacterium]|nr:hypothetical protein [Gammaproteobacteria bacterium]|tara:strand:- start:1198 stop:1767 length:570 start_codon:yes stop_codon:yes gene_type:complete